MNHDEKVKFGKIITRIAELYDKKISPIFLAIYWEVLSRYSLEQIEWAVRCHMGNPDSGQFMPRPGDFVRYLDGNSHEKALHAWTKVLTAAKRIGAYDSVVFDDQLIHYVIGEMGGWVTFCHSHEGKLPFLFQEFSRRYVACLKSTPKTIPTKLSGIHRISNPHLIRKDC